MERAAIVAVDMRDTVAGGKERRSIEGIASKEQIQIPVIVIVGPGSRIPVGISRKRRAQFGELNERREDLAGAKTDAEAVAGHEAKSIGRARDQAARHVANAQHSRPAADTL